LHRRINRKCNYYRSRGTAPYTGTGTFGSLAAGTYSYTCNRCQGISASVSVTINSKWLSESYGNTRNYYLQRRYTSVSLSATGGTTPYTYGGTTTNLPAGTYTFTVADAAGCSAQTTITITQPLPITTTQTVTNVTCNGGSDGSVVITPSGGTPTYTTHLRRRTCCRHIYIYSNRQQRMYSNTISTITQPPAITLAQTITNVKLVTEEVMDL